VPRAPHWKKVTAPLQKQDEEKGRTGERGVIQPPTNNTRQPKIVTEKATVKTPARE